MRFDTSQQMKLGQQMKLAPRMIQSMEILQMPLMALQERIEQELESNIALEQIEPGGEAAEFEGDAAADAANEADAREAGDSAGEQELMVGDDTRDSAEDFERLDELTETYGDMLGDYVPSSPRTGDGERDGKMDAMANIAARSASLEEQLLEQWRMAEVDDRTRAIGELLIGYIGDDGFMAADAETILAHRGAVPGLELDEASLEHGIDLLQAWLEPRGLAARSLRESLLLQIEAVAELEDEIDPRWNDVRVLLADHFDDVVQNRLPKIAAATGLSLDRIQDAISLMPRLDLSPGRRLVDDSPPPVIPDIIVEYDEDTDSYVPSVNGETLPGLQLSAEYAAMAKDKAQDRKTREFVGENVQRATWIMDAIRQRTNTLLRVANVVVAHQRDWFEHGSSGLKPLPMTDVADQLGIHVATVSRAVSDKWMQTPRGIVPLRPFFSGGRQSEDGRDMSWEAVRAKLEEIIDAEDKARPMSDEALAKALKEAGISIARRTVVKYRQQLGIPSARHRKVFAGD
jgi:RNA polymerase sigma-54 factor